MNKTIVAILKQRMKTTSIQAAGKLTVGQDVKWTGRSGVPMYGIVTKVKIKMVEVNAGPHGRWNVAATLLSAA
jgi:surface antigen